MDQSLNPENTSARPTRRLTLAWAALIALSLGAAALTLLMLPAKIAGGLMLLLALFKARIILAQYLELAHAPDWLRGFTLVLVLFAFTLFGLFLI
jgi:nitric oxide reductase NorF protein